jgi:hypothetical protein
MGIRHEISHDDDQCPQVFGGTLAGVERFTFELLAEPVLERMIK